MAQFRLLAGQHIQADKTKPLKDAKGQPTGKFEKQIFTARGSNFPVVESDRDLVADHGDNKFQRVDGGGVSQATYIADLERQLAEARAAGFTGGNSGDLLNNPAVAPNGQVSSGWQSNGGPLNPDHAERAGVAGATAQTARSTASDTPDDLDGMTVAELRDHADSHEIDLAGVHRKDEIIAKIRAAR